MAAQALAIRKLLSKAAADSTVSPGPPLPRSHPSPRLVATLHLEASALCASSHSLLRMPGASRARLKSSLSPFSRNKDKDKDKDKDRGSRKRKEKHRTAEGSGEERRSVLTGKKVSLLCFLAVYVHVDHLHQIKLKVHKGADDLERDANRADLLQFLNSAYE